MVQRIMNVDGFGEFFLTLEDRKCESGGKGTRNIAEGVESSDVWAMLGARSCAHRFVAPSCNYRKLVYHIRYDDYEGLTEV